MEPETLKRPRRFHIPGDDRGQRYVYTVTRWKDPHTWEHCRIEVRPANVRWDRGAILDMTWQTGGNGIREWYAGKYEIRTDSVATVQAFARLVAALRDVGVEAGTYRGASPLAVCEALESLGIAYGGHDPVFSEYRAVADLSMAPMASWRDDWNAYGQANATVGAEAATESEARRLIRAAFAERDAYRETMLAWMQAGEPVRAVDRGLSAPLPDPATLLAL